MRVFDDEIQYRKFFGRVTVNEIMYEANEQKRAKKILPYNKEIFEKGSLWYKEGLKIEDAPETLRENSNFVRGFELAARQEAIKKATEIHGANWFFSGRLLEEAPEVFIKDVNFVNGYNDAKKGEKHRR